MTDNEKILIGCDGQDPIYMEPSMICRHGLIAGATGTGKTTTLKVMAESFSEAGIPVFMADVKGDLAASAFPGSTEAVTERARDMGLLERGFSFKSFPVNLWDVYGKGGMPLRTTVSEMGPLLLSQAMGLTDTQRDVLTVIFKIADDEGLLLIDTKDLKAMVQYVGEKKSEYSLTYGNMAPQTLAAIQRAVIALEMEGADVFLGEPALDIHDWLTTDEKGFGTIQILDCRELFLHPRMYAMYLLWMLSELFETLPEEGNLAKPKVAFFFDEAHLLFNDAPKILLQKVEQMVKLVRSKGIGVYFITQSPSDLPDEVLAQLGNKIQHALHAYTPAEMKKLKAVAQAFRENPGLDTLTVLQELGTGKALVSVLDAEGIPTIVRKTKIAPPSSRMGTVSDEERQVLIAGSPLTDKYLESVDRDSAYEFMERRRVSLQEAEAKTAAEEQAAKEKEKQNEKQSASDQKANKAMMQAGRSASGSIGREIGKTIGKTVAGKVGKTLGGNIGAALGRGLFSTFFGS